MAANQQVHPDHRTKLFTSAGSTDRMLAAVSPSPAGALAATKHDEDRVQKEGGW